MTALVIHSIDLYPGNHPACGLMTKKMSRSTIGEKSTFIKEWKGRFTISQSRLANNAQSSVCL
jgi:hypothetical protein